MRWCLFIGGVLFLFFFRLDSHPLLETTEARYTQMAQAMSLSGNLLEPRFNGFLHLHKPPLTYWLGATALALTGGWEFSCRMANSLCAVLLCLLTGLHFTAKFGPRHGFQSGVIMATSLGTLALARGFSTDMPFAFWLLLAHHCWWNFLERQAKGNDLLGWLFFSLAFLTKGFVALILPIYLVAYYRRRTTALLSPIAILLFVGVGLGWYLIFAWKNPQLISYFLWEQGVERVATDAHHRSAPFGYFFLVYPALLFPFSLYLLAALWREKPHAGGLHLEWLWVMLSLLLFSLSRSKLPTYMLPLFPPAASLIAGLWEDPEKLPDSRWGWATLFFSVAIVTAFSFATLRFTENSPLFLALLYTPIALVGAYLLRVEKNHPCFFKSLLAIAPLFLIFILNHGGVWSRHFDLSLAPIAEKFQREREQEPGELYFFKTFNGGLPFYLKKPVTLLGVKKDLRFDPESSTYLRAMEDLQVATAPIYLVTKRKIREKEFGENCPFGVEVLLEGINYSLVRLKKPQKGASLPAPPNRN